MKLQILMDYLSISWTTFIEHKWTRGGSRPKSEGGQRFIRGGRDYIRGRGRGGIYYIRGGRSYLRGGSCPPLDPPLKWTNLEQIADSTFFNTNATLLTSEMILSELTNKPLEVLIALTYPKRNYKSTFEHLSQALDKIFLNLGKPFLKAAYKIKVTPSL